MSDVPTAPGSVLITSWGWHSHLRPLLPLAHALHEAGHEVTLAVPPSLARAAGTGGPQVVPVGQDIDALPAFRSFVLDARPPTVVASGAARSGPPRALQVFLEAATAMVDDLAALGRARAADLVIFEPTALAGPLAAAVLGVPAARHLYGPDLMWRARRWLGALLEPIATRLGLPGPPDPYGAVTIDPTPDALIIPDEFSGTRLPVRHGAPVPPAHPAYPVLAAADRPIVVTWGETMALLDERLMLSVRFAQALADGTAPVLVAAPPAQRRLISTQLAAIPSSRVRVVDDTQLPDVLAHAAAVVSQGGAGTVLTGLAAGVPQVVVGQLPDHLAIGRRVAAAGAGIALTPAEASDAVVREAVATVLADPGFAAKARVIARENAARPVPADLVAPLRRLATAPTSAAMIR